MGGYSKALQLSHKASWPRAEFCIAGVGCSGRKGESRQYQAGEASLQPALQSNAVPSLGDLGVMGSHLPLREVSATPLCSFGCCHTATKAAFGFGWVFLGSTNS